MWNFGLLRLQETGRADLSQIWLLRNRQFARTLLNRRKQLRQLPSAIAGVLRMEYHDTVSTTPFLGIRGASISCGAVRRDSAFRHGRKLDGAPSPGARPQ